MKTQAEFFERHRIRPTALVTGASAGIGAVFAQRFAQRGCDLILVARRRERLDELGAQLRKEHGVEAETLQADLTKDDDIARVAERIRNCGNLEFLVNNAGFGTKPLFHESDLPSQDAMVRLHVLAPMHLTHAALAGMIERSSGVVINVSSIAGFFASPSNVTYCSTKSWLISFSEALSIELTGTGVRVQVLCPGFTYSEFHDVMGMDRQLVPKKWWLPAEYVVDKSLRALRSGKLFVIPSVRYKLAGRDLSMLPRRIRNFFARKRHRRMQKHYLDS